MKEYMFWYDTIEDFTGVDYVQAKTHKDAERKIADELRRYGGGHADVFIDGDFRFDVEV